ncbi:hypothetical protein MTBSS4_250014 [Magnetospirillum sp. SS-4]|nr:hypothetical protein MTBSS4_250014 [Magnetospirillum sp. SS-4]
MPPFSGRAGRQYPGRHELQNPTQVRRCLIDETDRDEATGTGAPPLCLRRELATLSGLGLYP